MGNSVRQITDVGLAEALEAMDQGVLWLDENLVVLGHNQVYRQLLEIEPADRFIGRPCRELFQFLLERGEFLDGDKHEIFPDTGIRAMHNGAKLRIERVRPNGTVLSIAIVPLHSGGYVYTYLDVTHQRLALEDVQRNTKATVVAMAILAEHRDTDTGAHVLRVARLAGQTARQLHRRGLFPAIVDEAFIDHVTTAAILHDVGKIAAPDRILLKAGPLNDEERATIMLHAATGAQLLKQAGLTMNDSRYLNMGAEIALTHHEWFDGSGYPDGLAGDGIPLSGRICAVADVFDALTSRRPYKSPWSIDRAAVEIRQQGGRQFDPVVVEAFLDVIRERETVSLVQWAESMSVGNQHIDEQHMILIDTINQLASAESRNDRPVVAMIIDELVGYAAFHFHFEEQLMEDCGYPQLESHRRIHQGFVKWVMSLREEFVLRRRAQLGERIMEFLRDWLRNHILQEDQRYRPFIGG